MLRFYQASRMGWWDAIQRATCRHDKPYVDEVMIGDYPKGGGVGPLGEFGIRWYDHGHRTRLAARLEVFGDAWAALGSEQGRSLVAWLVEQHGKNPAPEAVCAFLVSIGCVDKSDVKTPTVPS